MKVIQSMQDRRDRLYLQIGKLQLDWLEKTPGIWNKYHGQAVLH